MGYQAVFTTIDWEQKRTLVDNGEIDCIWGCFSMDGREQDYQWAGPYMVSRQIIAVNAKSDIYAMGDLNGKTIAVQSTGKPEEIFLQSGQADIPQFEDIITLEDRGVQYAPLPELVEDIGNIIQVGADKKHIFEQFARERTSTVSKMQGTGLGLAITKSLVDMMGGRITVESEPGGDSEFTISLRFPLWP